MLVPGIQAVEGVPMVVGPGALLMVREGTLFVACGSVQLLLLFRKTRGEVCPRFRTAFWECEIRPDADFAFLTNCRRGIQLVGFAHVEGTEELEHR